MLVVVLGGSAAHARAQTFAAVGVRAQGMAGAFVAVADDATAVYWNPAGLATGGFFTAVGEVGDFDLGRSTVDTPGVGIPVGPTHRLRDGSGALIALGVPALGAAYYHLRTTGFEGELTERRHEAQGRTLVTDNLAVNVLQSLAEGVHLGASLRVVRGSAGAARVPGSTVDPGALLEAAAGLDRRASWRFDVDAGVLVARGRWRAGLTARNLVAPSFDTPTPDVSLACSRQARAGLAFLPRAGTTLAVDADLTRTDAWPVRDRQVAVGVEQVVAPRLTLRGGFRVSTIDDLRPAASIGGAVALTSSIWLDAQATRGSREGGHSWAVGLRLGS
jgi:hypothetical protein